MDDDDDDFASRNGSPSIFRLYLSIVVRALCFDSRLLPQCTPRTSGGLFPYMVSCDLFVYVCV